MKIFAKSIAILFLVLAVAALFSATKDGKPGTTNIVLQSKDGGLTWEDISYGLPDNSMSEDFFAGTSEVHMRVKNVMYRRNSNLKTPVWEKTNDLDSLGVAMAFNRTRVKANHDYYEGQIFQKVNPEDGAWLTVYTDFKKHSMRSVYDSADASIFLGYRHGLYKSVDNGESWKRVPKDGRVMPISAHRDSKEVFVIQPIGKVGTYLLCGRLDGIYRSADMGKTWSKVHSGVDKEEDAERSNSFIDPKPVFSIHVSGTIVYAVARINKGC